MRLCIPIPISKQMGWDDMDYVACVGDAETGCVFFKVDPKTFIGEQTVDTLRAFMTEIRTGPKSNKPAPSPRLPGLDVPATTEAA